MIRPKLSLRRPLAILGAALIGLTGVVAVATPASAHHTTITATADCDRLTGERVITWKVENSEANKDATLDKVTANPDTPVTSLVDGVKEAKPLQGLVIDQASSKVAVQRVPGNTTTATLTVHALWIKEGQDTKDATNDGTINLAADKSCAPSPKCVEVDKAEYSHTFDGPKGTATVKLDGDLPLCGEGKQWFTLVSYFAPRPQFATPQYVYGTPDSDWIGGTQTEITLNVEIPDCHTQVDLIWGGKDEVIDELVDGGKRYDNKKLGSPGAPGNRSKGPQGWYNGGNKSCTTPASTFASKCDGSVAVSLSNDGKISKYAVEFEVKAENGFTKKVSVAAGKADSSIVVPAADAGKIEVLVDGKVVENGTYSWQRPEDCPLPAITTKADCENFALTATNPEGGLPVKATFTYDGKTETRTVAAGASETVTFKAGKDKTAIVALPDMDLELEAIYTPEGNCGGGGAGGEEPGLPVTGAAAGGIAAGAIALLIAGAVLFVIARRRRVTFTA
ncbi:cell wall anchor protein [Micromonospora sp. STR1_7]|uniref:Cell wall anchor protein n=1 Tax=Micromonospora parastrephiae TaxID=2806101 RepID=A0ABS1XZS8_9ACTN|nr:cell wall anchor protein [Micromonospora parastrephiae]MBM0234754.1 cell wall anchor protein [Micromonospora parastrephiae]